MERREQLVRDSLDARAGDVQAGAELWDEVQFRIDRRRRWRVSAWVAAGVAAGVIGVLVIPGLVGGATTPEIDPLVPPAEEAPAEDPVEEPSGEETEEPGEPAPDADEAPDDGEPGEGVEEVAGEPGVLEPAVAVHGAELLLVTPDGARTLVELPQEGHSTFLSVAVRPGSTPEDLTVVTVTTAEGFEDVRWTRMVDGEVVVAYEAFEGPYAPAAASDEGAWVSPPVWSPDGRSVAWLDQSADGTALRTVGWSDGPGTGDPADDNASFDLTGELPNGAQLDDWVQVDETTSWLRATTPDSSEGWYAIELQRQADGALSREADAVRTWGAAEPELGPVGAVGGVTDDGAPRWLARLTVDGLLLEDVALGERTELPDDLLPGDGLADVWLRDHGGWVVAGSRSTGSAYRVLEGDVVPLGIEVTDLAVFVD